MKWYDNSFNSWVNKKDIQWNSLVWKMSQYFPKPFKSSWENINGQVDLSNYAIKTALEN